jgi:hypothetical protein
MFRSHVPSVQASKARAIVNLAGQVGIPAVTLVGSIGTFTHACYQRIPALSNLSDPSAGQSVRITSTKGNLE